MHLILPFVTMIVETYTTNCHCLKPNVTLKKQKD